MYVDELNNIKVWFLIILKVIVIIYMYIIMLGS